ERARVQEAGAVVELPALLLPVLLPADSRWSLPPSSFPPAASLRCWEPEPWKQTLSAQRPISDKRIPGRSCPQDRTTRATLWAVRAASPRTRTPSCRSAPAGSSGWPVWLSPDAFHHY